MKKLKYLIFAIFIISCQKDDGMDQESIKDADGNIYHTVVIGSQTWMIENLKTTHYRNGDEIQNITDGVEWNNLTKGAYCNYNNDTNIGDKYGKLYNWHAVNDSRAIAPEGWHLPTIKEWEVLKVYVSANLGIAGSIAKSLAAKTDWPSSTNPGAIGNDLTTNNSSGFTGLPGGFRYAYDNAPFDGIGYSGNWWSSEESNDDCSYYRYLDNTYFEFDGDGSPTKKFGMSVRCIKD